MWGDSTAHQQVPRDYPLKTTVVRNGLSKSSHLLLFFFFLRMVVLDTLCMMCVLMCCELQVFVHFVLSKGFVTGGERVGSGGAPIDDYSSSTTSISNYFLFFF